MHLTHLTPAQAVSKALLRIKPSRADVESFRSGMLTLLRHINGAETEEFNKNLISDFLRRQFCPSKWFINTKGYNDLVIHNGADATQSVGIIIEAKNPTNKAEMMSAGNINVKAFHELLLYYLRERFGPTRNLNLRHIVATNSYEWFIFDAVFFEKEFAGNHALVKRFEDFEAGRLSGRSTDFFYREIAAPAIAAITSEVRFAHFDLRDYGSLPVSERKADDLRWVALYRVLSPEHLLKLPFANDSNTLNEGFYAELLHIIGLTETNTGGKRLISRKKPGDREGGSLIENVISQLDSLDKVQRLSNASQFGATHEERLFNVGLELVITWVNRITFLKLLEAQLISYNPASTGRDFLNITVVPSYVSLNSLFFQVLAKRGADRPADLHPGLSDVPYLNSSLFEPSELEQETVFISQLEDKQLPVLRKTVLHDAQGRKKIGALRTLEYVFQFLDAYDFGSEAGAEIKENNKPLISASVLGLIFEKINGYKDGAFFTPGFITMYSCREVVRRAVLHRFNSEKGWSCEHFDDLYDAIDDVAEANAIVNSVKICDPAVGSGHFLVSALNEMIAVKAELRILRDRNGQRLKEYSFEVTNDELAVTDEDGAFVSYRPASKESLRLQEAIFHEKQTIIEGSLFGVDVNPNSANICRLRLWIELLKHAYYTATGVLETLPNIDINIKQGNSLIARFELDTGLDQFLKRKKLRISDYRAAVSAYQNARTKDEKRAMEAFIGKLKGDLRTEIFDNDPMVKRLRNLRAQLEILRGQQTLFSESPQERRDRAAREAVLVVEIDALEATVKEIRENRVFEGAFEWRFEFPEALNDDGSFAGFDAVIGNPPYGVSVNGVERKFLVNRLEKVPDFEIFYWFINLSWRLLKAGGTLGFIIPNSILFNVYAASYRASLFDKWRLDEVLDCSEFPVFDDAVVRNAVVTFTKGHSDALGFRRTDDVGSFRELVSRPRISADKAAVLASNKNWGLLFKLKPDVLQLVQTLVLRPTLDQHFSASQGFIPYRRSDLAVKHGREKARSIVENREWHADHKVNDEYIEEIYGGSLTRYTHVATGSFVHYGPHVASYVPLKFFNQRRLLVREITNPRIIASLVDETYVNDPQIITIIPKTGVFTLEALWAILNSKVATFYHFNSSPKATKGLFPKILVGDINKFPFPADAAGSLWQDLQNLVQQAFAVKQRARNADVGAIENAIDELVYDLFGLSSDERGLVERNVDWAAPASSLDADAPLLQVFDAAVRDVEPRK